MDQRPVIARELFFLFVISYAKIHAYLLKYFGLQLRGLGFFLRHIKEDRGIKCDSLKFFFNHRVSGCYVHMMAGIWNEPETHTFLRRIFSHAGILTNFIDVGANIGEMIIDVARLPNVGRVIGFEPHAECAKACKISAALNALRNIEVRQKVLSNYKGLMKFHLDNKRANASHIADDHSHDASWVESSTIDEEARELAGDTIILIDVEGSELEVVKGGSSFIEKSKPLIIFEYNNLTRQHFRLEEMMQALGDKYRIFRLRSGDGLLDLNMTETWNCCAVHEDTWFYDTCMGMLT